MLFADRTKLPRLSGKPISLAAFDLRLRADGRPASRLPQRNGTGDGAMRHNSTQAVQNRRPSSSYRSPRLDPLIEQLSLPSVVPNAFFQIASGLQLTPTQPKT